MGALAVSAAVGACASQGMPPGGPADLAPPVLLAVTPESGAVRVSPSGVEFRFDEVVSERPRGAPSLEQLAVISPSDGPPSVSWERNRLIVRPRRGWREGIAYTVTILPGLTDLRGNAAKQAFRTVFSTGATIPGGVVRGVAFDWMAGTPARGARIEATIPPDTLLRYSIAADSTGRFALGSLPAGVFALRVWVDLNANGQREPREPFDTTTIAVADSARRDFYLFARLDTVGARMADVTIADSTTIRVKFDRGLQADPPLEPSQFRLLAVSDSSAVELRSVSVAAAFDSAAVRAKAAREDSIARADTSERGRRAVAAADSVRRVRQQRDSADAQIAAVRAARDTTRRDSLPKLGRPVPPTDFVIVTAAAIPTDLPLRLIATDIVSLDGRVRTSEWGRSLVRRKPPSDSAAARRPPPERK